jgi:hypothetical protein
MCYDDRMLFAPTIERDDPDDRLTATKCLEFLVSMQVDLSSSDLLSPCLALWAAGNQVQCRKSIREAFGTAGPIKLSWGDVNGRTIIHFEAEFDCLNILRHVFALFPISAFDGEARGHGCPIHAALDFFSIDFLDNASRNQTFDDFDCLANCGLSNYITFIDRHFAFKLKCLRDSSRCFCQSALLRHRVLKWSVVCLKELLFVLSQTGIENPGVVRSFRFCFSVMDGELIIL